MGKNLIQQARGKGSPTYRSPSHRFKGRAMNKSLSTEPVKGIITDFVHCPGHSAPLARIVYEDGEFNLAIASKGMRVGDEIIAGSESLDIGNTVELSKIPEGTFIYNIETQPGDGGKMVRASGAAAKVVAHIGKMTVVQLPSKKQKRFNNKCRACIGTVAGGHRVDKPLLKAGTAYYKMKAKNKLWPKVSGNAQNAVDHPFGNSRSQRKSKAKPAPKNAPAGRKVGMIRPRRTGRKKR